MCSLLAGEYGASSCLSVPEVLLLPLLAIVVPCRCCCLCSSAEGMCGLDRLRGGDGNAVARLDCSENPEVLRLW